MRLMYCNSALPIDSHPTVLEAESQDPGSQGQLSHLEGPGGGHDFWQPHSSFMGFSLTSLPTLVRILVILD